VGVALPGAVAGEPTSWTWRSTRPLTRWGGGEVCAYAAYGPGL